MHKNLLGERLKVVLIGAGGSGSQMLTGLARMAVALNSLGLAYMQVLVFDDDRVSESNIGRQLFSRADIGQNKAAILVNRINAYFGSSWAASEKRFGNGDSERTAMLYISCVDSAKSRKEIWEEIRGKHGYWLDLGNSEHSGQAILGNTDFCTASWQEKKKFGLLPCVADLYPEMVDDNIPEDDTPSCSLADALEKQDLMVNQIVVTHALEILWQLFRLGEIAHHGFFFDSKSFRLQPMSVEKEEWAPIIKRNNKKIA